LITSNLPKLLRIVEFESDQGGENVQVSDKSIVGPFPSFSGTAVGVHHLHYSIWNRSEKL
jgi:hypothetical protein